DDLAWNGVEDIEQAIEDRQRVLRQEQLLAAGHAGLASEAEDRQLIGEVASSAVPPVVRLVTTGQRGVDAGHACGAPLFEPFDQRRALAKAKPAQIEGLEAPAAACVQPSDSSQSLEVVVV